MFSDVLSIFLFKKIEHNIIFLCYSTNFVRAVLTYFNSSQITVESIKVQKVILFHLYFLTSVLIQTLIQLFTFLNLLDLNHEHQTTYYTLRGQENRRSSGN